MKKLSLTTLGLVLLATSASYAGTPPPAPEIAPQPVASDVGFYSGLDGGAFWVDKLSAGSPLGVDAKFKTGFSINVPLGYDFGNGLTLGLSAGYDKADFDKFTGTYGGHYQPASENGALEFVPLMAEAAYKVKLIGKLSWRIGAGLGVVYDRSTFSAFDDPANKSIDFGLLGGREAYFSRLNGGSWDFGFEAFSGFSYEVCPAASLDLGYRFMRTNGSFSVNGDSTGHYTTNTLSLGFTVKF